MYPYKFANIDEQKYYWEGIKKFTEVKGQCLLWTGPLHEGITPQYKPSYNLKFHVIKFTFQMYNPNMKFDKKVDRIHQTCCNKLCLSKDHLVIKNIKELDLKDVEKRLLKGSIRQPPIEDQTIGCLVWKGKPNHEGYGMTTIYGHKYKVHMLAVFIKEQITEMPIDENGNKLMTLHICKTKNCCEPSHMRLGDSYQNMKDKIRDGTLRNGKDCPVSTIDEKTAKGIIDSYFHKKHPNYKTQKQRADLFKVSVDIVSSIDRGHSWRHLRSKEEIEVIEKRLEKRKLKIKKIKSNQKKVGLSKEVLIFLKTKIYEAAIIQPKKINDYKNIPCRIFNKSAQGGYSVVIYNYCPYRAHKIVCEWKYGKKRDY
jgi:hypothetical protein